MSDILHVFHRDPGTGQFEANVIQIPMRPKSELLPMLGSRRRLGAEDAGGPGVTLPVILGLSGLGSIFLSKSMKDVDDEGASNKNLKMAMKFLGFGAVGYSLFSIVSNWSSGASASDSSSTLPKEDVFKSVSGAFLSPTSGQEINVGLFSSKDYPVEILLSNPSKSEPIELIYQILAEERPSYLWFGMDTNLWSPTSGVVKSGVIEVRANSSKSKLLTLTPLTSSAKLSTIGIKLTLQVRRSAKEEWKTLSTVNFGYIGSVR